MLVSTNCYPIYWQPALYLLTPENVIWDVATNLAKADHPTYLYLRSPCSNRNVSCKLHSVFRRLYEWVYGSC